MRDLHLILGSDICMIIFNHACRPDILRYEMAVCRGPVMVILARLNSPHISDAP